MHVTFSLLLNSVHPQHLQSLTSNLPRTFQESSQISTLATSNHGFNLTVLHQSTVHTMDVAANGTPSKCSEAFAIVELLEHVLISLPEAEVLKCLRVNKFWKNVIMGSIKLQRKLFIVPIEGDTADNDTKEGPVHAKKQRLIGKSSGSGDEIRTPRLNPLFFEGSPKVIIEDNATVWQDPYLVISASTDDFLLFRLTVFPDPKRSETNVSSSFSWREMLLPQPPIKTVTVHIGKSFALRSLKII
ncbi:hypothetical protein K402DRAFT_174980 [Aulographum hederae CBS 113979]|uniref:Uncharacterized protein n=1 Tax=Aulographum hederae CBS 113979 TaxID=1176131 RepID=A0A6G1HDK7_9PEZI|nr:hypothetical protein K402DRAFT_174980 [Aulographum hederae CBS 113979]